MTGAAPGPAPSDPAAPDAAEPVRVWERLRAAFGAPKRERRIRAVDEEGSAPYGPGREPQAASAVLERMTASLGWTAPLARTDLAAAWQQIAGVETAKHASVEGFAEGVLLVRCESTAWATQLQLMRTEIARRIAAEYPDAGVDAIRFLGPNSPSWNHGRRSVPGRGPRDTYG